MLGLLCMLMISAMHYDYNNVILSIKFFCYYNIRIVFCIDQLVIYYSSSLSLHVHYQILII